MLNVVLVVLANKCSVANGSVCQCGCNVELHFGLARATNRDDLAVQSLSTFARLECHVNLLFAQPLWHLVFHGHSERLIAFLRYWNQ